jgi:hypothetical protein
MFILSQEAGNPKLPCVNWKILGIEMMTLWASLNQIGGIIFLITVEWNSRIEQRWLYIAYLE